VKLLYFAPVPWDSYEQRPHYFARHFLDRGGSSVLWVDPYPTRLPVARDFRRLADSALPPLARPAGLDVLSVLGLPLEPLAAGRWLNRTLLWPRILARLTAFATRDDLAVGVGRPSDLAHHALTELHPSWSFYDAMDDFPEFYRGRARHVQERLQRQIVRLAHTVYASSAAMAAKLRAGGAQPVSLTNAFDMQALPPVVDRPRGRVLGYAGCIGRWFDWPLVMDLARALPDAEVRLVGPCVLPPPSPVPNNVTFVPMCHQDEAIAHLTRFDAGLIPFTRTPLTESVDPIKYYAYRGLGLPVLSTAFGEMAMRGGEQDTFLINQASPFAAVVSDALMRPLRAAAVAQFRRDHDWGRRFTAAGLFESAGAVADAAPVRSRT
jgi:hypothetical protein